MAKREKVQGIDTDNVIMSAVPGIQRKELKPYDPSGGNTAEVVPEVESPEESGESEQLRETAPEAKEPSKRKRSQSAGYKETFLKRNEMKTRQCVYISYEVHAKIARLVRALVDTGNDISVGGYIDTVLNEHLQQNKDEINELYRQRSGDLI